ncbi:MAG: N-acetylglucosamine-6-phosphate deacetylase [Ostreibacterium sp.]
MTFYYQNAAIFNGETLLHGYSLEVTNGITTEIIADTEVPKNAEIIFLNAGILSPGYVETQANGGGGVLFNEHPTTEGICTMLKAHRQFGTVAMLPTFITDTPQQLNKALQAVRDGITDHVPGLIGGHFEGPFINSEKKGTHQANYIRKPTDEDKKRFVGKGLGNSLVTLAPECVPIDFIEYLAGEGFCINAGHTMATKEDMVSAYHAGLRGVTHLYNAMPSLQGRMPAVIGSAAVLALHCGIIADGIHSDAFSLQLAFKLLGKERLMLVTDSMHTIGVPEMKSFTLTGQKVFVHEDRLINEHGSLAGAHITMSQCVKNAVKLMGASVTDALSMAITTPANYIKRSDLAEITKRRLSDILYLDMNLNLLTLPVNKS